MAFDPTISSPSPLTPDERQCLLRLARRSIDAVLQGVPLPSLPDPTPALAECGGVFVSLHVHGRLRGCVGTLNTDRPLHERVAQMALEAAFDDPRFLPLTPEELPEIEIEISRLLPPQPTRPEEVVPGRDGVCVARGEQRAVFLPQVAERYGWTREQLLSELCHKAHLPPDAWQHPECELLRFEAEVFGEDDLAIESSRQ
jgi:hypothetical protein